MNTVTKAIGNTYRNIKAMIGILISLAYMVYHFVFLKVNVAGTAAMQLEDSAASYAVGKQLATGGNMYSFFLIAAGFLLAYNVTKLILNNRKGKVN